MSAALCFTAACVGATRLSALRRRRKPFQGSRCEDMVSPTQGALAACSSTVGKGSQGIVTLPHERPCASKMPRVALVVRVHCPSDAALERIHDWAADLIKQGGQTALADFWISIDSTFPCYRGRERVEHAIAQWSPTLQAGIRLHLYSASDLLHAYPVLFELLPLVVNPVIPGGGTYQDTKFPLRSLAWGFHAEAINLWFQGTGCDYDYVWVFEDDVGYSGVISKLILDHVDDTSDLISGAGVTDPGGDGFGCPRPKLPGCWTVPAKFCFNGNSDGWCWYYTRSASFHERLQGLGGDYRNSSEHVQRFSRRLLCELHRWSNEGASAWSEMSTPTVCLAVPGMRCRTLDPAHCGEPFAFDGHVTEVQWKEILQDPRRKNQLFQIGRAHV